ncbi:hypothetical protein ACFYYB_05820 [Streptomyces sp. NPDC002886]|uniref:hypothetical protein n=1 Tax=Streptomyces sp. NPDC002886 TaxID=3364667 RepID=UPI003680E3E0
MRCDAVRVRGHDLILIGCDAGAAPLADLVDLADTVVDALRRTPSGGRRPSRPAAPRPAVGAIGGGAPAVRYALAAREYRREGHRARSHFFFNGTAAFP